MTRQNMYMKQGEDDQEMEYHQGCLSGIIHAFDYHQWKKYKGIRSSDGTGNIHTTLLQNQEFEQLFGDSERQSLGTTYSPSAHKRTLKSRIKVFSKLRNCKKRDSEFSSSQQLQRTYSLHRLEPSDRRLDEIWKNKISEIVSSPRTSDSANQSQRRAQSTKDADTCEIAKGENELFEKSTGNGNDGNEMFLVMLPNLNGKAKFIKSGSFPTADMSRKLNFSPSKLENKINEFFVSSEGAFQSENTIQKYNKHFRAKSWHFTSDSETMSTDKKVGELFASLKPELKDEEKDKAIYPPEKYKQIIQDEQPKDIDDEQDSKCYIKLDEEPDVKRAFIHRKSYSLSDSMTRYSRLLEFTSRPDIELHTSKSLKLRNEYDPPSTTNILFGRIHSLSYLDYSFSIRKDEQGNAQTVSLPLETVPENGSFVAEDTNGDELENETVERIEDAGSLEVNSSIYIGDLEETVHNSIIIEENENCAENTGEFIPSPIEASHAESFIEKTSADPPQAYSLMNLELKIANNHFGNVNEKDSDMYYVRKLLARSTFCKDITDVIWLSDKQPLMNDETFEEVEAEWHQEFKTAKEDIYEHYTHHQILFDIVTEAILSLHDKTSLYYPMTLSSSCEAHLVPLGRRIEEEIIASTGRILSRKAKKDQSLDDIVHGDVTRDDGWMNLESESESVAMEVEDIIADELLEELLFQDLVELYW